MADSSIYKLRIQSEFDESGLNKAKKGIDQIKADAARPLTRHASDTQDFRNFIAAEKRDLRRTERISLTGTGYGDIKRGFDSSYVHAQQYAKNRGIISGSSYRGGSEINDSFKIADKFNIGGGYGIRGNAGLAVAGVVAGSYALKKLSDEFTEVHKRFVEGLRSGVTATDAFSGALHGWASKIPGFSTLDKLAGLIDGSTGKDQRRQAAEGERQKKEEQRKKREERRGSFDEDRAGDAEKKKRLQDEIRLSQAGDEFSKRREEIEIEKRDRLAEAEKRKQEVKQNVAITDQERIDAEKTLADEIKMIQQSADQKHFQNIADNSKRESQERLATFKEEQEERDRIAREKEEKQKEDLKKQRDSYRDHIKQINDDYASRGNAINTFMGIEAGSAKGSNAERYQIAQRAMSQADQLRAVENDPNATVKDKAKARQMLEGLAGKTRKEMQNAGQYQISGQDWMNAATATSTDYTRGGGMVAMAQENAFLQSAQDPAKQTADNTGKLYELLDNYIKSRPATVPIFPN